MYLGDFKEDGDIFFKFTTRAFATGIPTTLSGSPVLSVYKDEGGAATEKTTTEAYFDLDVDHDSIAGWNNVRIDLSGDAFFATGADYSVVITTGTVDSVNVFGENLANFSIENRSMGQPVGATLSDDIAAIKAETVLILADTNDIGVAGAGLTDLGGMSTGMKAEVESEADDALIAKGLDHLIFTSVTGTDIADNSIIAQMVDDAVTADWDGYDNTTASLEALNVDADAIVAGTVTNAQGADVATDVAAMIDGNNRVDVGSWLGNAVTHGTGGPDVNINAVSDDTTAAANLELQYDTTGLTGDTFPASQAQVGSIGASAGGALNFEANADNSGGTIDPGSTAFVGVETNNFTDTDRENGTRHIIEDATNVIDLVYGFSVGGDKTATEMVFKGFANVNGDDLTISAWDHPGSEWETLGTLVAKNSTSNITVTEALLSKHTGTGSEIGKVYIRFNGSSLTASADLNTDQILIEAVVIGQSIGYAGGQIWVNTALSNTNTENFVDGVADNPVSTITAAKTLSTSLSIPDFHIINGSSITLGESTVNESYFGDNWTLALGGQDVGGAFFSGADVTGTGTGSTEMHFAQCEIGNVTVADAHFDDCDIEGIVTLSAAANYNFINCSHSGTSATIDFGSGVGNTTVHLHNYHGAITVKNMGQSSSTDVLHFSSSNGKLTLDSTCIAGTVNLNGTFDLVNNGSSQTLNQGGDAITLLDAIKVPTDKMVFTNTNELDANTKSINDAEVVGDGNATPWDGA